MDYLDGAAIYNTLANDSDVTTLTTAIYKARLIPETETSLDTINCYPTSVDGGVEYFQRVWSVDCRSDNEYTSQEIASRAFESLNRIQFSYSGKMYFTVCSILGTIPPLDKTDVYNTPITVIVRRR